MEAGGGLEKDNLLRSGVMLRNRHIKQTPISMPQAFASIELLLLFYKRAATPVMVKHSMDVIRKRKVSKSGTSS